jgi:oligosaccharide repeat unit polymerase
MNIFPRPEPRSPDTRPRPVQVPYGGLPPTETWVPPWPRVDATFTALIGLVLTAFAIASGGQKSSELAATAAYGVGLTLLASFAFEARSGLKNLVRADLMGVLALYYLTLYEFLFEQPFFDKEVRHTDLAYRGIWAVMIGFAGLFIGRHLLPRGKQPFQNIMTRGVPTGWLVIIFWICIGLGFFHMLWAVSFNVPLMVDYMMKARFEQPWGRGRLGDWTTLLNELELLLYLVPPIAGLMLGKRERYSSAAIFSVVLGLLWTLFYGFLSGTRSLFGAYLVTFMIAFTFASPQHRRRQALLVCGICASLMIFSTKAMLQMRTIGFKAWLNGEIPTLVNRQSASVFVDDNLLSISIITGYFPDQHPYLGHEIPYLALIRPIPRALWKIMLPGEKPTGLSIKVEDIFNQKGVTIAATFVGEGYMSGGYFAIVLMGIFLGWLAAWWNRLASPHNSELGLLIYASGFFAVTITMRSLFALTTAVLPCVAGLVIGRYILPVVKRSLGRRAPVLPPKMRKPPGAS